MHVEEGVKDGIIVLIFLRLFGIARAGRARAPVRGLVRRAATHRPPHTPPAAMALAVASQIAARPAAAKAAARRPARAQAPRAAKAAAPKQAEELSLKVRGLCACERGRGEGMRGVAGEAPGVRARPRSRSLPRAHARSLMVAVARGHAARAASAAPNAALRRGERTPLRVARAGRRAHGCAPRTADPRRFPAGSRGACECDRPCAAGMNRARCGGRCRRSASRVLWPATAHPRERS